MHNEFNESTISHLVSRFYETVRQDNLLGPIFERHVGDHWDEHLERLNRFWRSVLLASCEYHGDPPKAHAGIAELAPQHFDRWLALFELTATELFAGGARERLIRSARGMRRTLETRMLGGTALRSS